MEDETGIPKGYVTYHNGPVAKRQVAPKPTLFGAEQPLRVTTVTPSFVDAAHQTMALIVCSAQVGHKGSRRVPVPVQEHREVGLARNFY